MIIFVCFCETGVAQVLNRLDGKPFDDADQRLFEVIHFPPKIFHTFLEAFYLIQSFFLGICDLLWAGNQQHHHV